MAREMKDSGIPWIGDIPKEWGVQKVKNWADGDAENSFIDGDWIESPDVTDHGIRYLTTGNIGDGFFKRQGNGFVSKDTFVRLNCKYAYPCDLVISRLNSPYGRSCILPDDYPEYVLAVDNVILRTNESGSYLCFATQCDGYHKSVEEESKGTTMKRISRTNLGNVMVPHPPLPEQQAIADFLDKKCSEIDELVVLQEKMIDELKSYKQSVITEAVTKGLDPNVPMKDSGIDWIGEIPEGWEIRRLKTLCRLKTGGTPSDRIGVNFENQGYPWITAPDISEGFIIERFSQYISKEAVADNGYSLFEPNSVLLVSIASVGKIGIVTERCYSNQQITGLTPNESVIGFFLLYSLVGQKNKLISDASSNVVPILNSSYLKYFLIPTPSICVQQKIVDFLSEKCSEIDSLIKIKQDKIEALKEYKKSIIFEYVTGKKEVV